MFHVKHLFFVLENVSRETINLNKKIKAMQNKTFIKNEKQG